MSSDPISRSSEQEALLAASVPIGAVAPVRPGGQRTSILRWVLPVGAVAVAALLSTLLFASRPEPSKHEPELLLPLVRTVVVERQSLPLIVVAHGTVSPGTESDVVAEVRGRIMSVSPSLVAGGFFRRGDELLRLDAREHQIAVDRARASLALRSSEAKLAAAEAARFTSLRSRGATSIAGLEQAETRTQVAKASVDEAAAALAQAELELERTVLRAPFDGRVRQRAADVGQFVNPGTLLARIHSVDYAEVRLPIQSERLADFDFTLGASGAGAFDTPVALHGRLAGRDLVWPARLVRTESEIDERTRMAHVVARVEDPYLLGGRRGEVLPNGLFVRADISGRTLEDVIVLPLAALRDGDRVYVLDDEDRLRLRDVEVVRRGREQVVVGTGLATGERVVVSPLRTATDGMLVQGVSAQTS